MKLFAIIAVLQLGALCALTAETPEKPISNLKKIVEKTSHAEKGGVFIFKLY